MPSAIAGLRRDRAKASTRMTTLAAAARGRSMTDDEQHDFDAAAREVAALDEQISAAEAAETEATAAREAGTAASADYAKGAADERTRIKAILGGENAKGREDLAQHFAFDTDMSAESVVAALAKAPKASAEAGGSFQAAMRGERNPDLGTGKGQGSAEAPTMADRMRARHGVRG